MAMLILDDHEGLDQMIMVLFLIMIISILIYNLAVILCIHGEGCCLSIQGGLCLSIPSMKVVVSRHGRPPSLFVS